MINLIGPSPEAETVTLLNTSQNSINPVDWSITDRLKNKHSLYGTLAAGATLVVASSKTVQLGNNGAIITLLNKEGLKVHGILLPH